METAIRMLVLAATLGASLTGTTKAQEAPDPRVADLVQSGKIRLGLFLPGYTTTENGEIKGSGTGSVAEALARILATRLGVELVLVAHEKPAQVLDCLKNGGCDLAYMGIVRSRADAVDFTPPFMQQDFTYLVPDGSSIRSAADADQASIRIAVVRGHAATLSLSRTLKQAKTIEFDVPAAAYESVRTGKADAWASARYGLLQAAAKFSGARVLEDRYGANLIALAVRKGEAARLSYIAAFVEEAKVSGLVQSAIDGAKLRGYQVVAGESK